MAKEDFKMILIALACSGAIIMADNIDKTLTFILTALWFSTTLIVMSRLKRENRNLKRKRL